MKKIFTREVKIALLGISALAILYFGLNYLKGFNLFDSVNKFYANYESVEGLVTSSPVYVKGYKVGQVTKINYDFAAKSPFFVEFTTEKNLQVPQGTIAELFDDGLMGGKAIRLIFSKQSEFQTDGDTLLANKSIGLMELLTSDFLPKIYKAVDDIDSAVIAVNTLLASSEIKNSLSAIERVTDDLSVTSLQLRRLMNGNIPVLIANIDTISMDLKHVSSDLKQVDYVQLMANIDSTMSNIHSLTNNLNDKNSSLGLLLNDKSLYNGLDSTINSANLLLKDLKKNPKRYVHFSLFGAKEKKKNKN